ncbi:hypothetical protein [Nocardioides pacificus]
MSKDSQVLVIGLDPFRVTGPWDPQPISEAIEAGMAGLSEAGYAAESCLVGLDGSDDVEARITGALQDQPWDCVLIGAGIRRPEELLELFESVVNLIRVHAPDAVIAFNGKPHDLADGVTRALGRAHPSPR